MTTSLRSALKEQLDSLTPPPADLELVVRRGKRRRQVRRAGTAAVVAGVAAALVVPLTGRLGGPEQNSSASDYASIGRLDLDAGLRAYADPGGEIHLGGRTFDAADLEYLDTDATATAFGVVFYDRGRPMLLGESGEVTALVEGPVESSGGSSSSSCVISCRSFHPTAKADSQAPLVAWATLHDGTATLTVRDMSTGEDAGSLDVACGDCDDLVIDALDEGFVFFRTSEGTRIWEVGRDVSFAFAGPQTRVADVRSGVLLYDGPAPRTAEADRYLTIPAPIDAQLTFDGRYILDWSSVLQNTRAGDRPVRLDEGPTKRGALGFWNIDTDGSVLVATLTGEYPQYTVFDCEIPTGRCAEVGPLEPTGGDPMFIGNDM
jgi:hypothetical protein